MPGQIWYRAPQWQRIAALIAGILMMGGMALLAHSGSDDHPGGAFTTLGRGAFGSLTPNENFFVNGGSVVRLRINANDVTNTAGTFPGNAGIRLALKGTPMWSLATPPGGDFQIFREASGPNAIYIKRDSLNVGIGTKSPTAKLHVHGNLFVAGSITKTGGGEFVLQGNPANPAEYAVYSAPIGGEVGTYLRGTARLHEGASTIELPKHFNWLTDDAGLTVQLTPSEEWLQLYVAEKSTRRIVVREAAGKSGRFDYLIQGVRRGFEGHTPVQQR